MLVLNEGMPRSGKSYDAIRNHVCPALRAGRQIYARLNFHPDSHERIAQYLGFDVEYVKRLLVMVDSNQVLPMFVAKPDATGEYCLDEKFHNALIIIDECHEFYVSGKNALPKEQHTFFAMHGHYSADILLMSQSFKDCHSGIRRRVERKTSFQKLSAVGSDNSYLATYYHSTSPEKYALIESKKHPYEPEYFPLYKGFKEGAKAEVYEGGKRTIWQSLGVPVAVVSVLLLVVGFIFWKAFHVSKDDIAKGKGIGSPTKAQVEASANGNMVTPDKLPPRPHERPAKAPELTTKPVVARPKLSPEQQYVIDLAAKGRPRLSARIERPGDTKVLIEWRDSGNVLIDQLNSEQLRALGVSIRVSSFGVVLSAGDERVIVTSWPTNGVMRDTQATLYDTSGGRSDASFTMMPPASAVAPGPGLTGGAGRPWIGEAKLPIGGPSG